MARATSSEGYLRVIAKFPLRVNFTLKNARSSSCAVSYGTASEDSVAARIFNVPLKHPSLLVATGKLWPSRNTTPQNTQFSATRKKHEAEKPPARPISFGLGSVKTIPPTRFEHKYVYTYVCTQIRPEIFKTLSDQFFASASTSLLSLEI